MMNEMIRKRLSTGLTFVAPLASVAVSPSWNWDPINPIKLLIISSIGFYCFFLLIPNFRNMSSYISKKIWIAVISFVVALTSSLVFSGAPLSQQFWGTFGRNTGYITYLSFLAILVCSMLSSDSNLYVRVVNALVITSIPMTIYCLIQVAKLDPIGWSELRPFGTLGNINFLSAFLGLSTICSFALIFTKSFTFKVKIGLVVLIITDLSIIYYTQSIQGLMMFIAGVGIQIFIYIVRHFKSVSLNISYLAISFLAILLSILGLTNRGPLAKFLFAPSIVFRSDYWHAGWVMTLKKPFFGVGLDSYGDWYRQVRGEISTLRTGPDRTANTAHNIFLDISSNGGLPLLMGYLAILTFAFYYGIKSIKRNPSPHNIALFTSWIGFLLFSAISINQVGVGIWGWLFTGLIIGSSKFFNTEQMKKNYVDATKVKKPKKVSAQLPASASMAGLVGLILGFIITFIPLQADAKFKTALQSGSIEKMLESVEVVGSTAFHKEMVIDVALRNNFESQALTLAREIVRQYPKDFMGWRVIAGVNGTTPQEKNEALVKLKELDPFNPNIPKS
jgi:O-antigen ligase